MKFIRSSALRGAFVGVVVATGFSLWVTFGRLLDGKNRFDALGVSWIQAVLLYYASLPLGGTIVGLLLPLHRWLVGCALLGFVGVLPLYLAVASITKNGPVQSEDLMLAGFIAIVVGGGGGAWV